MAMRNSETNQANELLKYLHPLTAQLVNLPLLVSVLSGGVVSPQRDSHRFIIQPKDSRLDNKPG